MTGRVSVLSKKAVRRTDVAVRIGRMTMGRIPSRRAGLDRYGALRIGSYRPTNTGFTGP